MSIISLFPKAVGKYSIERNLEEEEISFIKNQPKRSNRGNSSSVNNYILKDPKLKNILSFIEEKLNEYFKNVYAPDKNVTLRITQSWCNYTEPGQFHHKHTHPNSFISGVFYPQSDANIDKIYFYNELSNEIKITPQQWNQWNSESWWLEADQGALYIFPSNLTHMVETVQGNQTRISLSFNTFPVGFVGNEIDLTGLYL